MHLQGWSVLFKKLEKLQKMPQNQFEGPLNKTLVIKSTGQTMIYPCQIVAGEFSNFQVRRVDP